VLFPLSCNAIPDKLEQRYILAGTAFHVTCNRVTS